MDKTQRNIIKSAIRAPSGDNCQPWWFTFNENGGLEVGIYPERAKSFFDFKMRTTFLSVGAVLENIHAQAAYEGFATKTQYHKVSNEQFNEPLVTVTFDKEGAESLSDTYIQAIKTRTVNRRPFLPFRLAETSIKWLTEISSQGHISIYNSRQEIKKWAHLIYLADCIRYSHPDIHKDVFSKILLSKKEVQTKRLGLEFDRLGAGPLARYILKFIKPWQRLTKLSKFGIDKMLAYQSKTTALMTGAFVLVTVPSNSNEDWINAGKTVQKLWNTAEEKGFSIHPMTVALYLDARFREEGKQNFLPKHSALLETITSGVSELVPEKRIGVMLFRIGHGLKMKTPAIRLPEDYFIRSIESP